MLSLLLLPYAFLSPPRFQFLSCALSVQAYIYGIPPASPPLYPFPSAPLLPWDRSPLVAVLCLCLLMSFSGLSSFSFLFFFYRACALPTQCLGTLHSWYNCMRLSNRSLWKIQVLPSWSLPGPHIGNIFHWLSYSQYTESIPSRYLFSIQFLFPLIPHGIFLLPAPDSIFLPQSNHCYGVYMFPVLLPGRLLIYVRQ